MILGLVCGAAIWLGWVGPAWEGLAAYVAPVVCWQASACLLAAVSHLPFQQGRARSYSFLAIGFDMLQLAMLGLPLWLHPGLMPRTHVVLFALGSSAALLVMSLWVIRGRAEVGPSLP